MKNKWIDFREPPQCLVDLTLLCAESAIRDLANYAHERTVEILVPFLDNNQTCSSTINSLFKILSYEHLANYRLDISEKIAQFLAPNCSSRFEAVAFLSKYMASQFAIDKMVEAIFAHIKIKFLVSDHSHEYYINQMFRSFDCLDRDDNAYVARKIVTLNLVNPGINPYVIAGTLGFLYRKSTSCGISYAIHHLSNQPGYELLDYKFRIGIKMLCYDRNIVRNRAMSIIVDAAINKTAENNFLKEQIDIGMKIIIDFASKSTRDKTVWIYDKALENIWYVFEKNPKYSQTLTKEVSKLLPQHMLDRLKSP